MAAELKRLYKTQKLLGQGQDAKVYKVLSRTDNEYYAMKVVPSKVYGPKDMYVSEVPVEAKIMIDVIGLPGIVQLEQFVHAKPFEYENLPKNADSYVYVMKMDQTGSEEMNKYEMNDKSVLRLLFSQLAQSLRRIDDKGISHMDLHGGNVMIGLRSRDVTLIDFGRAQYKNVPYQDIETYRTWNLAVPEMRSKNAKREIVKNPAPFDYDQATVWCLARMIYEKHEKSDWTDYPDLNKNKRLPPIMKNLLEGILKPGERTKLRDVLNHPYFDMTVQENYNECGLTIPVKKNLKRKRKS